MSRSGSAPGRWVRRPGALPAFARGALVWAFVLLAVGAAAVRTSAQTTERLVTERRLAYQAAKAEHESALSAFRLLEDQFWNAQSEVTRARRSGNTDALDRAFSLARDRSLQYGAQEERVARTGEALKDARDALIEVVTVRLEQLLARMDAASSARQRAELNTLWLDLNNELKALEAEGGEGLRFQPVVMPEIAFDPRDGPAELRFKAELLERRAAVADTVIQDVDRQIKLVNDQIRIQRQRRDLEANLNRFDDTRLPVVTAQPPGDRPATPDSASAGAAPLTPEDRLRLLRGYRDQLEAYREQVLIRARTFRQSIRQVIQ